MKKVRKWVWDLFLNQTWRKGGGGVAYSLRQLLSLFELMSQFVWTKFEKLDTNNPVFLWRTTNYFDHSIPLAVKTLLWNRDGNQDRVFKTNYGQSVGALHRRQESLRKSLYSPLYLKNHLITHQRAGMITYKGRHLQQSQAGGQTPSKLRHVSPMFRLRLHLGCCLHMTKYSSTGVSKLFSSH